MSESSTTIIEERRGSHMSVPENSSNDEFGSMTSQQENGTNSNLEISNASLSNDPAISSQSTVGLSEIEKSSSPFVSANNSLENGTHILNKSTPESLNNGTNSSFTQASTMPKNVTVGSTEPIIIVATSNALILVNGTQENVTESTSSTLEIGISTRNQESTNGSNKESTNGSVGNTTSPMGAVNSSMGTPPINSTVEPTVMKSETGAANSVTVSAKEITKRSENLCYL